MGDSQPSVMENWSKTSREVYDTTNVTFIISNYVDERDEELKSKSFYLAGKEFKLGFLATGKFMYYYHVTVRLHNLSDTKVVAKANLKMGGVERIIPCTNIEPGKYAECIVTNPKEYPTEDGSLVIQGIVTLVGEAVVVGKDGI